MRDLVLLLPELVLIGMALALLVVARRVQRARSAATCVVIAAVVAIYLSWAFGGEAPRGGFGGTIAGDGYARFFKVLFAATLAPLALLALVIGLYPESVLGFLRASVTQLLAALPASGRVVVRL